MRNVEKGKKLVELPNVVVMPLDVTRSAQTGTAAALKAVQAVQGR